MDAEGDWRAQLAPEARSRVMNKILETLRNHVPVPASLPEGLVMGELQKLALRFEDKVYNAATSLTDYLRKISIKMLILERQAIAKQEAGAGVAYDPAHKRTKAHGNENEGTALKGSGNENEGTALKGSGNENEGTALKGSGLA